MTVETIESTIEVILSQREKELFGELRSLFSDYDVNYRGPNRYMAVESLHKENDERFWRNQKRRSLYRESELLLPYEHLLALISDWLDDVKEELNTKGKEEVLNQLFQSLTTDEFKEDFETITAVSQVFVSKLEKRVRGLLLHSLRAKILPYCKSITQTWHLHDCSRLFQPTYNASTREYRMAVFDSLEKHQEMSLKGALHIDLLRVWHFEAAAEIPNPQEHAYAFKLLTQAEGLHTPVNSEWGCAYRVLCESAFRSLALNGCTSSFLNMFLGRGSTHPEMLANLEELSLSSWVNDSFPFSNDVFPFGADQFAPFFKNLPKLEALLIFSPVKDANEYATFWSEVFTLPEALECFSLKLEGRSLNVDNVIAPVTQWAKRVSAEYKARGKVSPLRVFEICIRPLSNYDNFEHEASQLILNKAWDKLKSYFDPDVFPYLEYCANYSHGDRYE